MARFAPNPCCGISGVVLDDRSLLKSSRVSLVGKRNMVLRNVFTDSSHVDYYVKEEAKEMKVKKKLIKRLSKDLDLISRYGGEVKGNMISDAAEILLAEVRRLKTERKEEKRRRKAQRKAMCANESSSSCSSESGDDECREVVNLRSLRSGRVVEKSAEAEPVIGIANDTISDQTLVGNVRDDCCSRIGNECSSSNHCNDYEINGAAVESAAGKIEVCSNRCNDYEINGGAVESAVGKIEVCSNHCNDYEINAAAVESAAGKIEVCSNRCNDYEINGVAVESAAGKIEVCMGGKCKKMGAEALMEEFERKVGVEGAVVGCKCMGKCKNAPNVRVSMSASVVESIGGGDSSVTSPTNPLFLGVALNDVDMIVAHFAGDDAYQMMLNCT